MDVNPTLVQANSIIGQSWVVECWRRENGILRLAWVDFINNLVTSEGLNELLNRAYRASALTVADKIGLTDGTPTFAAGDTMASHAGWVEVTAYSEAARQAFSPAAAAAQSLDNSASKATFNINAAATIGGAFLTTDGTKGGTAGILIGGAAFSGGDRSLQNGDVVRITVTATLASA